MRTLPATAALLLIDIQKGFDDPKLPPRNNPQAEENAARLLGAWRDSGRPVVHVRHLSREPNSPLESGSRGSEIKEIVEPRDGEPVFKKQVNSAFIGTELEAWLKGRGYDTLVVAGLTTPYCVSTTARMAGNLGFQTYIVSDATAAFDLVGHDGRVYEADEVHAVSLATLHKEFGEVTDTSTVLGMLGSQKASG